MTLSYSHGTATTPLLGESIGANLRRTVERFAEREALVVRHQNYRATYRQLWDATTRAACGLAKLGVQKGDRIGVWAPNRWEWVVIQYATARLGAILVNINPAYQTTELEYVLNQASVSGLVLARGFRKADYGAMLAAVRGKCPAVQWSLVIDDEWSKLDARGEFSDAELLFDDALNI